MDIIPSKKDEDFLSTHDEAEITTKLGLTEIEKSELNALRNDKGIVLFNSITHIRNFILFY